MISNYSFTDPEVQRCPFKAYESMRQDGPVYLEPETGFYHILDYKHVQLLAADKRRLSNDADVMTRKPGYDYDEIDAIIRDNGLPIISVLVEGDDPDHAFHRSLVNSAFFPGRVRQMEEFIATMTEELIDGFSNKGEVELMEEFAVKLPMSIIADQLGVPREDLPMFKKWSDARVARAEPGISQERFAELTYDFCKLQMYVDDKAKEYREYPGNCILSDLVHADVNGRTLTREEIAAIATVLIVAGNETTTTALCHAMLRIAKTPGLESRLRDDESLLPQFIEEVLRLDAPLQSLFRRALEDIDVEGTVIPAGSTVVLKWGAANRDQTKFADPDVLDLERKNAKHHLTFGYGPHSCIGNQLARSEMRIAIAALLRRAKNWHLPSGDASAVQHPHYFVYGFSSLTLGFEPIRLSFA